MTTPPDTFNKATLLFILIRVCLFIFTTLPEGFVFSTIRRILPNDGLLPPRPRVLLGSNPEPAFPAVTGDEDPG